MLESLGLNTGFGIYCTRLTMLMSTNLAYYFLHFCLLTLRSSGVILWPKNGAVRFEILFCTLAYVWL